MTCLVSPGARRTFSKPFSSRSGRCDLGGGIGDVELRDFGSGHAAGIGYVEADRDWSSPRLRGCGHFQFGEAECGVAQTEAEREERMLAGRGPVAIADHQLVVVLHVRDDVVDRGLAVFGDVQRGVGAGNRVVVLERWVVFPTAIEADGQLAFGVVLAEEHLRQPPCRLPGRDTRCRASAGTLSSQRRVSMPPPPVRVTMVCGLAAAIGFDQRVLAPGQREGAVVALALGGRIEADGDDDDVGGGCELLGVR